MNKTLNKMGIETNYLNIKKVICDTPSANIIVNGEKLKAFPVRSGTRQGCALSPLLPNTVLEVLPSTIRQERNKWHEEVSKLSPFADDMNLYIENPKDSTINLLETINKYSKVAGYKNQCTKIHCILIS